MEYAVGAGGIIGTYLLGYALFGAEFMFPRWKRWAIGLTGAAMMAAFWTMRPILWPKAASGQTSEPCYAHGAEWDC